METVHVLMLLLRREVVPVEHVIVRLAVQHHVTFGGWRVLGFDEHLSR